MINTGADPGFPEGGFRVLSKGQTDMTGPNIRLYVLALKMALDANRAENLHSKLELYFSTEENVSYFVN